MSATTRIGLQRASRISVAPAWSHSLRIARPNSTAGYATATATAGAPAARRKASSAGSAKGKTAESKDKEVMDEAIKRLEQLAQRSVPAHMDIWSQPLQLQDVHVPSRYSTLPKYIGWNEKWAWFKQNMTNYFYNAVALYRLANSKGGIPGHHGTLNPYTFKIFSTSSTKPTSWLTHLRTQALDRYKALNTAFASNDTASLRQLTVDPLQAEYRNRLKGRATSLGGLRYVWKFHGEASPTRCVSIRANEGYVSSVPPKTGNTMFVQAVMRFDTMQSLAVYRKNGQLVQGDPEKPKRVVEYMVFEKRMWYDEPWVLREQVYEGVKPKAEE